MQEGRLDALLAKQIDLEARYTALSMQRPDLSTAIIPARYVAAIVICCLTIAVAIWRVELKLDAYQETLSDLKKEVKLYELKTDGVEKKLISAGIIKE